MRIGVVSDTHNNMPNVRKIVSLFNQLDLQKVVHTGDITQAKTLEVFSHLKVPLHGVYGNNDLERDSLEAAVAKYGFQFTDPPLSIQWHGRELKVVHDPRDLEDLDLSSCDLALHGHTHLRTLLRRENSLVFNPGECAGMIEGYNAIGVVDLVDLEVELIHF